MMKIQVLFCMTAWHLSAPIFSSKGVTGAINLIAEPEEVSIDVLKTDYAPKLMKISNQLSEALGYRG